jgi:serine/threonine protein kinase
MPQPNQPQPGKPPAREALYGETRSDAAAGKTPPLQAAAPGQADLYGKTIVGAATPSGSFASTAASPYRTIILIGEGGMGQVYLAHNSRLDRLVALKRISGEQVANEQLRRRFLTEARANSQLVHYHIVQIFDLDEDAAGPFIAMEYVPGPLPPRQPGWPADAPHPPLDLEEFVKLKGPLDIPAAVRLGRQLLSAVGYAHQQGIIHRDIKPANILLNAQHEPKLADFGLARQMGRADEGKTLAGAQLLSLGYGAPEQEIDASRADHRADLYAVAATLWFALTGQNPRYFRESEVPQPLRPVLLRGLEKDREKRFPSAAEFDQALQQTADPSEAFVPVVELVEEPTGAPVMCPRCGHAHPAAGNALAALKFCEQCGARLQEPCPRCKRVNGIWVKFCGSCRFDIVTPTERLIRGTTTELQKVSELLEEHEYVRALQKLNELSALEQPRLAGLAAEAKRLFAQAETAYDAARKDRDEKLNLAHRQIAADQFEQAAQVLAQVPVPLHDKAFARAVMLVQQWLAEKQQLKQEIANRVSAKEYRGLLPKVEQMIALEPQNKHYTELLAFLQSFEERQAKKELREEIANRVSAKEYEGLVPMVERMIALEPQTKYYTELLTFLRGYHQQLTQEAEEAAARERERQKGKDLLRFGVISLALGLLGILPPVSLAALVLGSVGAIRAHHRLEAMSDGSVSELGRRETEVARILNFLGALVGLLWLVGCGAYGFFSLWFGRH